MKYKVSELEGDLLDAAVVLAESNGDRNELDRVALGIFSPSTEWKDGGPIMERERRAIVKWLLSQGESIMWVADADLADWMRAYVASKFGEEVELP